jgi:TonB-dependent receptor
MWINQLSFNRLASVLFSFMFLMSFSALKAQVAATTPVEGQGNTLTATTVSGVSELPEVTVKAKGIDQAAAFDEMHDSLNKVNILSQDQINQTPAKSVAQAAQQFPGVGVQHDTSEPRYIDIRGTDSNLNIITFDQTIIPSYDESERSVDLDALPAGLFGEMEVFKTILPDMDAQGVGGQMNLVPKKAQDYPGGLFELNAQGGYVPQRSQGTAAGNLTWGDTFGLGGTAKLGILVATQFEYRRFGIDDLENGYSDPADPPLVPNSVTDLDFRYYDYERERAGIGTSIDLSMDKDNKLTANLMYGGYDEYREPVWHTDISGLDAEGGAVVNPDGSITVPASQISVSKSMTSELTQFRTLAAGLGGVNNLGGFMLDYKASFAYTDDNVPYSYGFKFKSASIGGTSLTYNNSTNNGNSPTVDASGLTGLNDPTNYVDKSDGSNSTNVYTVNAYGLKADGKFDTPLGGDDTGTVKFGAAARWEYSDNTGESFTATHLQNLNMSTVLGATSTPFYLNNMYNMGPLPDMNQAVNLLNNPGKGYYGSFVQTDPNNDQGGDYNNWEDVYAGYGMYTLTSGKMTVMAGARVEVTHIQYNWWDIYPTLPSGDPDTSTELPAVAKVGTIDYANALPSLGFNYKFNDQLTTRMNFSETIARPTQSQYIPSFNLSQALDAQNGDQKVQFTFGNPNLKPMISNNFDFSCELYPQKGAILAMDAFYKSINNYFGQNYAAIDNSGGVTDILNYINIPSSAIYGVEFQYQQQYTMLPGFLGGLGFRGSISFLGSQGELSPGLYGELPSQSDLLWNTGVFYKKDGFTFDIGGDFTGKNLTVIGDPNVDNAPNIYYDDYFQIDAKAQYAITKNFTIYADGNNLNNANHRFYQGSSNYPIQNEYYGATVDGGVVIDF